MLTLALLQMQESRSDRALPHKAREPLGADALPALGTLWYRLATVDDARWHAFLV